MSVLSSQHVDEMAALLAVATELSFVNAGRTLQRHPTIVSKRIAALERRLGVRLLERTTRRVKLTEAGMRLVDRIRSVGAMIAEAEQEASAGAAELRGKLRLAFPAAMGRLWLAPLLPEFLQRYPLLTVEAQYSERFADLVADGFDAALRVGFLGDSRLIAKKLSPHHRILCASPDYVRRCGAPSTTADLASHNCLGFTELAAFPNWRLSNGESEVSVLAKGSLISNDSQALLAAARGGIGILGVGEWLVSRDIASGTLVRILADWRLAPDGGIYLVRPSAQFTPARTDAFLKWITGKFIPAPPWAPPWSPPWAPSADDA